MLPPSHLTVVELRAFRPSHSPSAPPQWRYPHGPLHGEISGRIVHGFLPVIATHCPPPEGGRNDCWSAVNGRSLSTVRCD
jgi:hypothetical protein